MDDFEKSKLGPHSRDSKCLGADVLAGRPWLHYTYGPDLHGPSLFRTGLLQNYAAPGPGNLEFNYSILANSALDYTNYEATALAVSGYSWQDIAP